MNDERGADALAPGPDAQATMCATLVDEWVRCGLTDAVICPGSRSTPMTLAVAADERVRVHVHHDERSGSFLALGLAATSGRPVVVITTSGTAVVQLHAAAVEADLAGVPLILCTADRPPELRDVAAPQTVDQTHLFGRALRYFTDPGVADPTQAGTWRSLAARVWAEATAEWPGPVQVNLPFREPLVGTAASLPAGRGTSAWHRRLRTVRSAPVLDAALTSARGIVIAGRGTADPDGLAAFADAVGWPVLADPASGCAADGRIDAFDAILRTHFADRARPDVVVRSGGMPASKVLGQWLDRIQPEEIVIAPAGWWPDPGHHAAVLIDAVPAVADGHEPVAEWLQAWRAAADAAERAIDDVLAGEPLSEPGVARHLTRTLPPGGVLVASSSMPVRDVEWFGVGRRDVRVVANRGANGIDGVVSTAVGAALTGAKTTLLIGDIAFLHDSNGLLGLADRGVDLTIVVLDNDGGGIFSFLPQRTALPAERFERLFGTPHGLDLVAVGASIRRRGRHGRFDRRAGLEAGRAGARRPDRARRQRRPPRPAQRRRGRRPPRLTRAPNPLGVAQGRTMAESTAWNLASVSASSAAGSESATTPTPAKSRAVVPSTIAERMPTAHVPFPAASTQPTAPAYRSRSRPSWAARWARAGASGQPETAGVGCSACTSSSTEAAGEDSRPSTSEARCCTLATATTDGSGSEST